MTPEHEEMRKIALDILTSAEARLKHMGAPTRPDVAAEQTIEEQIDAISAVMGCGLVDLTECIALDVQDCYRAIEYAAQILQTVTDDNAALILAAFRLGQTADRVVLLRPIAREKEKEKGYRKKGADVVNRNHKIPAEVWEFIEREHAKHHAESPELNQTAISKKICQEIPKRFGSKIKITAKTIRNHLPRAERPGKTSTAPQNKVAPR